VAKDINTIRWENGKVKIIDQTKLPAKLKVIEIKSFYGMIDAIKTMKIRGAPAIGAAAAFGLVLGAKGIKTASVKEFTRKISLLARTMILTRPTAVNLSWAVNRLLNIVNDDQVSDVKELKNKLLKETFKIADEDIEANKSISKFGSRLIKRGRTVLTHCNAGGLATVSFGTALGVIREAHKKGKKIKVMATETRPRLQGAKLTMWELKRYGIPSTLITDNMVGYFMSKNGIDAVVVGADRIAANGDVANKIGTYGIAVLAKEHGIPFYVAAPLSTIDADVSSGKKIPIEERNGREVQFIGRERIAPAGIKVSNPAFDVTPSNLITALITDAGIIRKPYKKKIKKMFKRRK